MTVRRGRVAALTASLSVAGLVAVPQAALADVLTPDSPASSTASDMRTIYIVMLVVTGLIFLGVVAALLRAVAGGRRQSEPTRHTVGTRGVQRRVGVGLGAAVIVLFVVGIVFTEKVRDAGASESSADPIAIQVTGQQWLWRYEYPEADDTSDGFSSDTPYSYYDLTIPVDTPITLNIGSTDVIHTWSVPALTRSVQAVPGDTQSVTFVPDKEGTFYGHSNQFSGPGYSTMRTAIHVVSQDEYEAFLAQRTKDIQAARAAVQKEVDNGTAPGVALEQ